jgi:indolepyruvate ferredoxin oxidoreductase beta subunit
MDILIVGVGGQGTLLASRVLGKYALDNGLDCKLSEVHGMSQRGGSVITFVRIGDNLHSPIIDAGNADVVIAFEKLEALRYAHYLNKDGLLLYSSQEIMPMPVVTGACKYPDDIETRLPSNRVAVNALELAERAGSPKAANSVMIGAFAKRMNLDKGKMKNALMSSIPPKLAKINDTAFELGYNA